MVSKILDQKILSLEEHISRVVEQSRSLTLLLDRDMKELEDLLQTAIALNFLLQALKRRLELAKATAAK